MARKTDAQAERSREWLAESLLHLMKQKQFQSITVSEIAEQAQLDRRTFYRHFRTKEQVLRHRISQVAQDYELIFQREHAWGTREISYAFFAACQKHQEFLLLLHEHELLVLILYELNELFPKYHFGFTRGTELYAKMQVDPHYALSYHVGGFWNVLVTWVEEGCRKSPEELSRILTAILPANI